MLLKPPISEDAAFEWLKARVIETWDPDITPEVEKNLRLMAESMAKISAVDLPVEIEPLLI